MRSPKRVPFSRTENFVRFCLIMCLGWCAANAQTAEQTTLLVQNGHTADITALAYSPVGSQFASGSADYTIKVWNTRTGQLESDLIGHSGLISSLAFSPNGQLIASGSHDGTVRLWDAREGKLIRVFGESRSHVLAVAFSPDGSIVASAGGLYQEGSDTSVRLWEVQTGQQIQTFDGHEEHVNSVAFSPDGATLASGSGDGIIKFWDVKRGKIIATFENKEKIEGGARIAGIEYQMRSVELISFNPNGRTFATVDGGQIRIRSIVDGSEIHRISNPDVRSLGRVAFSPNWRMAIAGGFYGGRISLLDMENGNLIFSSAEKNDGFPVVAFSNDGRSFVTGADVNLKIWNRNGGLIRAWTNLAASATSAVYRPPDGSMLAWANDKTISIWDVQAGKLLRVLEGHSSRVNSIAFSPDGKLLVSGSHGNPVKLWSVSEGRLIRNIGDPDLVYAVAFSHDGQVIASGSSDEQNLKVSVNLWDSKSGRPLRNLPVPSPFQDSASLRFLPVSTIKPLGDPLVVLSIAFDPSDKTIAAGSSFDSALLWDVRTGRLLHKLEGHSHPVTSVVFSPDGTTIATAGTNIKLWNVRSGQLINTIDKHTDYINVLAYSPDGSKIASASNDRTAKVWEVPNGKLLRSLEDHASGVNSVAFRPDGRMLLTSSIDATIRLWAAETGYLVATFMTFKDANWLAYTPDNFFKASPAAETRLTWRRVRESYDISKFRGQFYKPEIVVGRSRGIIPAVATTTTSIPTIPVRRTEAVSLSVAEESLREKWKLMRYYALIIGNGAYPAPLSALKTPLKNAEDIAHILENNYGFEVELLRNASREKILGAIDNYRSMLDDNSSLIIYYAGHGDYEEDTTVAHWLPIDAKPGNTSTWISSDDVVNRIRGMKARHVLLVADSCFSGGFFGPTLGGQPSDDEPIVYLNTMMERVSRFLMTSGDLDFVDEVAEGGHSLFSHAFIQGLENHRGNIFTARQLFDKHIRDYVTSNARVEQRPQFGAMANSARPGRSVNTGNFVFIRKRK